MTLCVIIDDNAHDRSVIRFCLERNLPNITIHEADNGADGCQMVRDMKPEVAVVDLRMPGMDGFATIECISTGGMSDDIQLVVLSGTDDTAEQELALDRGARAFFTKPDSLIGYQSVAQEIISFV